MQLTHKEHHPPLHQKHIVLICDDLVSPANVGSIFRLSDAFGVEEILFFGTQPDISSNRLRRTARNTEKGVRFRESVDLENTLVQYIDKGYYTVALEITENSIELSKIDFENHQKIVILIGNERSGVSNEGLDCVHQTGHITMFGENSSMNVAQATGILLYEITRR